jgi:hypothetical protein
MLKGEFAEVRVCVSERERARAHEEGGQAERESEYKCVRVRVSSLCMYTPAISVL